MISRVGLLLLLTGTVFAQSAAVTLAGVELRIGTPKDKVLATYATLPVRVVRVQSMNSETYLIRETKTDGGEGGSITFAKGTLSQINVTNHHGSETASVDLAKAIYNAVMEAEGVKGNRILAASTSVSPDAKFPIHQVKLTFMDREVIISIARIKNEESVQVDSSFSRP